jgi:hypothetical protein
VPVDALNIEMPESVLPKIVEFGVGIMSQELSTPKTFSGSSRALRIPLTSSLLR